jgi:hypothetical protein
MWLGVSLLAATALVVGVWALVLPRSFYADFPAAGRHWVSALGPYNEHLVRDVGALNLALGALLVLAAIVRERLLVQAALAAWLVYAVPHFVFHATELDALPFLDNAANVITLGLAVLLPLVLLAATGRRRAETGGGRR